MNRFKHINARTLEEAASILKQNRGKARVISGGTDLVGEMKDNILPDGPGVIVNIKSVPGLDFIRKEGRKLIIGALTRLEDIAQSQVVRKNIPMLAKAAGETASPHIREMGTIGGNLSQSNRCWYYWVPENRFYCLRKGGRTCYALTGDGRYHSIFGGSRVKETPCSTNCPDNVDIPDYMAKIRENQIAEAARLLMQKNPLPAITGRVCPHFCETECNRIETDEAVSIRGVERYLGDYILENSLEMYPVPSSKIKKKIAIVGSGPAGLSAAYFLRLIGYKVTVLDSLEIAGGLLVYGIPPYRLSRETVRKQIAALAGMGIQFQLKTPVKTKAKVKALMSEYDAVFAACGAWKERPSGIKGEDLLISGSQFLKRANSGDVHTPGQKVAVLGGGNVAIDVARTLLRLGSEPVIIYRRGKAEMPALRDEVEKTEEEGIQIQFLTLPAGAQKKGNKIALKCQKMELGAPDESGRPRPMVIQGSDFVVEYDAVITAFGEEPDTSFIPREFLDEEGYLKINETTFSMGKNLFAGGDFITGPSTVVNAIASGRKAAESINRFLNGPGGIFKANNGEFEKISQPVTFNSAYLKPTERSQSPELSVEARVKMVNKEETGNLKLNSVKEEANRCLNCSCVAVNPSDLAPALIALNARIVTTARTIEAESFFSAGINKSTVLDEDEIVKEIEVPFPAAGAKTIFTKFALRKSIDFPVINCAAAIETSRGVVKSARICLNSVYNQPIRVYETERIILGKTLDEKAAENAAEAGLAGALPLVNNQYKVYVAKNLVKRAILGCTLDS
jgi:NADPH-dependent glutamate synthase beta subunit-like oxidoreductase